MVERQLPKLNVAGSSPVVRSTWDLELVGVLLRSGQYPRGGLGSDCWEIDLHGGGLPCSRRKPKFPDMHSGLSIRIRRVSKARGANTRGPISKLLMKLPGM